MSTSLRSAPRTSQEKTRIKRASVDDTVAKINARVLEKLKVEAEAQPKLEKVEAQGVHVYTSGATRVQQPHVFNPATVTPVTFSSTGMFLDPQNDQENRNIVYVKQETPVNNAIMQPKEYSLVQPQASVPMQQSNLRLVTPQDVRQIVSKNPISHPHRYIVVKRNAAES